jgi:hypothetical protein
MKTIALEIRSEAMSEKTWKTVEIDNWAMEVEAARDPFTQARGMIAAATATMKGLLEYYHGAANPPAERAALTVTVSRVGDPDDTVITLVARPRVRTARRVKRSAGKKAPA